MEAPINFVNPSPPPFIIFFAIASFSYLVQLEQVTNWPGVCCLPPHVSHFELPTGRSRLTSFCLLYYYRFPIIFSYGFSSLLSTLPKKSNKQLVSMVVIVLGCSPLSHDTYHFILRRKRRCLRDLLLSSGLSCFCSFLSRPPRVLLKQLQFFLVILKLTVESAFIISCFIHVWLQKVN